MGRIAGPERPPVMLPKRGRQFSTSMAIPRTVLITASASAPAASASRGDGGDEVTFGESLTMSVLSVVLRAARTTRAVRSGSQPKVSPSLATFGTRNVQLDGVDLVACRQTLADVGIVVDRETRDAADELAGPAGVFVELALEIPVDAGILQTRSR